MRAVLALLRPRASDLEVDAEVNVAAALRCATRDLAFPGSALQDEANLLVTPNVEAVNLASGFVHALASGAAIGPV